MARQSGSGARIIGVIVLILLLCAGVYVAIIANSAFKMRDAGERLKASSAALETNLNNGRLRAAYDNVLDISYDLELIDTELNKASWTLARNIPYFADDIIALQEMVAIGNDLSEKALLPVCRALETTLGGMPETTRTLPCRI